MLFKSCYVFASEYAPGNSYIFASTFRIIRISGETAAAAPAVKFAMPRPISIRHRLANFPSDLLLQGCANDARDGDVLESQ